MKTAKIALVCVANHFESGGERWETLMKGAKQQFENSGLEVISADRMVWDAADAMAVVDQFSADPPDMLVIIHVTWVCDTIQYLFVNNITCPVVLWAVPYTETFSIGCVQHFGSILKENGYNYSYVYGLPENSDVVEKVVRQAKVSAVAALLKDARIALIGPRQTWRVANSQDMVKEEWDFSKTFGATIIHIEMDELQETANTYADAEADKVLEKMKNEGRLGKVETDQGRMRSAAKVYLGVKALFERYGLTAAAAECYPMYGGLVNLPSSWLADEGLVLDTEGDIGHTLLMVALNNLGTPCPAVLAEIGSISAKNSWFDLAHEGSTAHSLAEDVSKVVIQDGGDGTMVGLPYKPLPEVTMTHMVGTGGNYKMMLLKGSTERISHEEWVEGGSKLMLRFKVDNAWVVFDNMLENGFDHHLIVKEGDVTEELGCLCDVFGVEKVRL